ncbi:undecaprenyl-diphosphate phosphatase [Candidatus Cytomitobacter indipagum]|uniref:Undecaprenyl-diphosphatase n=1 Tax=Candidatus Cytomitobacter indipagum TaxID=2601575 RepID=A0A5C0UDH8_9PROT|nr:undecaprenyl-diphosphate phosphatase [Candidatus Cytomitobacter indipagum]QEK37790.1 undecaprenyl-diphosphate phosphatase [Candidatus Cytomitobacter indipagum]
MIEYFLHGIFEAFPISSSMHLMLLGYSLDNIAILHGITAIVAIIFFHKTIIKLLVDFFSFGSISWKLFIALMPKLLVGFALRNCYLNYNYFVVILFGLIFFAVDYFRSQNIESINDISYLQSLLVGIISSFSFFPGASSLGTYYTAFRIFKINRKKSLDLSLILNIIPSIGAFLLKYNYIQISIVQFTACTFMYFLSIFLCRKLTKYLFLLGIYRVVMGMLICINIRE